MYGYESWTTKKAEHQRIDAFELWCWRRLLRVPWTGRRSNQSILKEISPECSLEGLMLKLKLQYLATWCKELTYLKRPWCWERLKAGGEGDDRGWDGWIASPTWWTWVWASSGSWWWTGSLACGSPWGHKESDSEESWPLKNQCFWIMVLEKTLESPLECEEIQPTHPKGDQSWVFIGRTDAEAEAPILWPGKSFGYGYCLGANSLLSVAENYVEPCTELMPVWALN